MTVIIILTALIATFVGSISGIGGGVLIKPVMDAIFDATSSQISFYSGTTVLTMTIVSLIRSRKEKLDPRGLWLAVGGAAGGYAGKMVFDSVLKSFGSVGLIQNIIMVILTGLVFVYTMKKDSIKTKNFRSPAVSLATGLFLGVASSFLGIGGGPINLMFLSYFFSMDTKTAALSSLWIIFFSQAVSFISSAVTRTIPEVDLVLLFSMMACAVIGATVGRMVSKKLTNKGVDKLFMGLLIVIIFISIYNCFRFA